MPLRAVRAVWLALAPLGGPALASTLGDSSRPVVATAALLAALGWGMGVVAVLVPRTLGLSALRVLAPAALASSVVIAARSSTPGLAEVSALAWSAVVTGLVLFASPVVDAFVDGSSYGSERRFSLRPPIALLLGPAPAAWAVLAGPVLAGPLLVADGSWVAGAALLLAAVALGRPAARAFHQLARRWLVFVPAGVVVHDPLVLADPVLVPKRMVRSLRPAEVGDEEGALDLTRGVPGLVMAVELAQPMTVGLIRARGSAETVEATRLLVAPARPGAVLAEVASRGLPS